MRLLKPIGSTGAFFWALCAVSVILFSSLSSRSQSSDQAFPTAVTDNEIEGKIKARDIGDARLTTYFYTFNGHQGDLFINVVTKNLNGSIDVFLADNLQPLSKIIVYADIASNETGRVIYLRKPEKLLLRVEGRTPNDDAAEFHFKFAGSFEAAIPTEEPAAPKVSDTPAANGRGVRVNSVGTIIETPKPKPTPKVIAPPVEKSTEKAETQTTAATDAKPLEKKEEPAEKTETQAPATAETKPAEKKEDSEPAESKKVEPAVKTDEKTLEETKPETKAELKPEAKTEEKADSSTATSTTTPKRTGRKTKPTTASTNAGSTEPKSVSVATEEPTSTPSTPPKKSRTKPEVVVTDNTVQPKPDPMANINLVILFKDGGKIERPMTEVLRFTVDRGILTVISKNGTIGKYSIVDVASVTIQ
jgi:hypothetical protein